MATEYVESAEIDCFPALKLIATPSLSIIVYLCTNVYKGDFECDMTNTIQDENDVLDD